MGFNSAFEELKTLKMSPSGCFLEVFIDVLDECIYFILKISTFPVLTPDSLEVSLTLSFS
jgi:hypothetical protein